MSNYKFLLAPGNAVQNAGWIQAIANKLASSCKINQEWILSLNYNHWTSGQRIIDFNHELNGLRIVKLNTLTTVFAKSAGIILIMLAVINNIIKAKRFVFAGFPYYFAKRVKQEPEPLLNKFAQAIKNTDSQIIFLQKPEDPAYHYNDLKIFLQKFSLQYELIEYNRPKEPIDDHHYADIEYLVKLICE